MNISSSRFITSSASAATCPPSNVHEYAFIGRSNVGKSSLINMLTGHKGLAMTSSTPGKTLLINHFAINEATSTPWVIVDLPGYGYAKRSKADRDRIRAIIEDYILNRPQLTCLFVLIDSRHKPQAIDMRFMEWLATEGVPFAIVFTKLDKLTPTAGKKTIEHYLKTMEETWEELPPVFRTSSEDKRGRTQLLDYIDTLNALPVDSGVESSE